MPLTIELTPVEEARLRKAAQQKGIAPAELVRQFLESNLAAIPAEFQSSDLNGLDSEQHASKVKRIRGLRGKLAHLSVTSEDLHRERQADKAREERSTEP